MARSWDKLWYGLVANIVFRRLSYFATGDMSEDLQGMELFFVEE